MKLFRIEVDIAASPDLVWAVMSDVERWHEWTPTVASIRRRESGPLAVGSTAMIRQPKLPPALWKVTELDPAARSFTWITRSPGLRVTARHGVVPHPKGSRATLSIEFSGIFGGLAARLTRSLNESYLALEANGLRSRCERST